MPQKKKPSDLPLLCRTPYREGGKVYLLYSVAGESGIAIAELRYR